MSHYTTFAELGVSMGRDIAATARPVVCVQGLGYVGAAMAIAVAAARDSERHPRFNVVGVDLPAAKGRQSVDKLNAGEFPFKTTDAKLSSALEQAMQAQNLLATTDTRAYGLASVVFVDVGLDLNGSVDPPSVDFAPFRSAIRTIGEHMPSGCLVIVETTVPPGTCDKVVAPELAAALQKRGLQEGSFLLAHSYERAMPGEAYFDSIVNYWRVYAGHTEEAAEACEKVLASVIDVARFPLTRLSSTTASETAKVLENSYRAANIAFMEEWGRFAEAVGIDMFEVVSAIRQRPTHSNIRQPGFGVGGYCLTKDPLFAWVAARTLFGRDDLDFPFSTQALAVNRMMPLVSLTKVKEMVGGDLEGKTILLAGVSYRADVADTRCSPAESFIQQARTEGARVRVQDPLVDQWPELGIGVPSSLPSADGIDAIVFGVPHPAYRDFDFVQWLSGATPHVLDANDVLTAEQRADLQAAGCKLACIGRGDDI